MPNVAVETAFGTAGILATMPGAGEVKVLAPVAGLSHIIEPAGIVEGDTGADVIPQILPHQSFGRGVVV